SFSCDLFSHVLHCYNEGNVAFFFAVYCGVHNGHMKGVQRRMYHNAFKDSTSTPTTSLETQRAILHQLRSAILQRYRPHLQEGAGPIRVMARIVSELEQECRKRNIEEEVIRSEIVNRTIGDVNLRLVTEYEGESGGPGDYRRLADEM